MFPLPANSKAAIFHFRLNHYNISVFFNGRLQKAEEKDTAMSTLFAKSNDPIKEPPIQVQYEEWLIGEAVKGVEGGNVLAAAVDKGYDFIKSKLNKTTTQPIFIFGYSRGGVAAAMLAQKINKAKDGDLKDLKFTVELVALIDPVTTNVSGKEEQKFFDQKTFSQENPTKINANFTFGYYQMQNHTKLGRLWIKNASGPKNEFLTDVKEKGKTHEELGLASSPAIPALIAYANEKCKIDGKPLFK